MSIGVTIGARERRTGPGDRIQGGDTPMKCYFFAAEFTKNTVQTTLEGGEGGSGEETMAINRPITFERTMTEIGRQYFKEKIG